MKRYTEEFRRLEKEEGPINVVYFILRDYFHGRILDAGCGNGWHLLLMPKGSIGIDLYPNKKLKPEYELLKHDLNAGVPFKKESFDVIFASHVLEHLESPYKTLREFHRCLKRGATLIVGIPNPDCIYFDYYSLSKESDWSHHLYAWNLNQGIRFITNCGFAVERSYTNFPFSKRFGKIWNSIPPVKQFSGDLWFIARKKDEKVYLKPSKRNFIEKILRKVFGSALSQTPEEK